jgi:hypothetical protein
MCKVVVSRPRGLSRATAMLNESEGGNATFFVRIRAPRQQDPSPRARAHGTVHAHTHTHTHTHAWTDTHTHVCK